MWDILLGGSWVVLSGVRTTLKKVVTIVTLLITLLLPIIRNRPSFP